MPHQYANIAFTESVRREQLRLGSRAGYSAMDKGPDSNRRLDQSVRDFVRARDSFYMASVGETGWPYVQHRGGPAGFVKILDDRTVGFADFRGNRQYVSLGNFRGDGRVALIFMDYPNQRRLKMYGRVSVVDENDLETLAALEDESYRAVVERGFLIEVEAFDWNCPQHITPRYTQADIDQGLASSSSFTTTALPTPASGTWGTGPIELTVRAVRQLTPRVRAYEFVGDTLPDWTAGAHLEMPVPGLDGQRRHYSLNSDPTDPSRFEIAVQEEPEGRGGSRSILQHYQVGTTIRVGAPINRFALHDGSAPALLIAGGIGITPLRSMAWALRNRGNEFELHFAGRSAAHMAYLSELKSSFHSQLHSYRSDCDERMDIAKLLAKLEPDVQIYACGPQRLMDAVLQAAEDADIATTRIHVERFQAATFAGDRPFTVRLARSSKTIDVGATESTLTALERSGFAIPSSCQAGECGTCVVAVLDGEVDHRDTVLSPAQQQTSMCSCVSRARDGSLTLDL